MLLIKNLQARQSNQGTGMYFSEPQLPPTRGQLCRHGKRESQMCSAHTITSNVVSTVQSSTCSFVNHVCLRPPSQQSGCYSFHYFLFIIMKQQPLVFQPKKQCSFLTTSESPLILVLCKTGHRLLSQNYKKVNQKQKPKPPHHYTTANILVSHVKQA